MVQPSQAAPICVGCQADDPGVYLGNRNALTSDISTFGPTLVPDIVNVSFIDYFVFDIQPAAFGGASANFQLQVGPIASFRGSLFLADATTNCPAGIGTRCTVVATTGASLGSASAPVGDDDWTFVFNVDPGRYILVIQGDALDNSAYTGQLSFRADRRVPEPGILMLLAFGLIAFGLRIRARG